MRKRNRRPYVVDLVFCVDATGGMNFILDLLKDNALNVYAGIQKRLTNMMIELTQLRIRIVAFRDYYYDKENAMLVSDFFTLPDQEKDFEAALRSIKAKCGGDDPEDGLEALAFAMKSKWDTTTEAARRRHMIIVWSDDATHKIGFGSSAANYPANMAKSFEELSAWWGSSQMPGLMDESAKRLLMFTPGLPYWTTIRDNWNNTVHFETEAGAGLDELEFEQILNVISNTI